MCREPEVKDCLREYSRHLVQGLDKLASRVLPFFVVFEARGKVEIGFVSSQVVTSAVEPGSSG
jgi:hypothetical protein